MNIFIFTIILLLNVVNASISLISPIWGQNDFKNIIIDELNKTNHSITATIYKLDDNDIINTLETCGKNNIFLNLICDKSIFETCNKFSDYGVLIPFKMDLFTKLHAKSILIDNSTLIIGSFNLDKSAFNENIEIGAIIKDKDAIQEYNNFITKFKE